MRGVFWDKENEKVLGNTKGEGEDSAAVKGPQKRISNLSNLSCMQKKGVGGKERG